MATVSALSSEKIDRWRRDWDEVMGRFFPGGRGFEDAMAAVTQAVCGGPPARVLDLGGGPGVFAERMGARWPGADVAVLDLDPVLLTLAGAAGVGLHRADLEGSWEDAVGDGYDLVTAVMTIHYLAEPRAAALYRAARRVLRPGGLLIVADLIPEPELGDVTGRLVAADEAEATVAWMRWWDELRAEEGLRGLMQRRGSLFAARTPAEFTPPVSWHRAAARDAGFGEAGVVWRWGAHAAVAAVAGTRSW